MIFSVRQQIKKIKKTIKIKIKDLNGLLGRSSKLSLEYKVLLYKTIIIPTLTYGLQMIQRKENNILRSTTIALCHVPNFMLHKDLNRSMKSSDQKVTNITQK